MGSENKVFAFLEKYLMGPMGKIASFRIVRAIMAAGMACIPFTIVGSMFLVLNVIPQTFTFLEGFWNSTFLKIGDLYMLANKATMGILALYFCLVIGYEYTKIYADEEDLDVNPLNGALLSMFAYFMAIPQLVMDDGKMVLVNIMKKDVNIFNGWEMSGDGVSRLGTTGIFTAIIMSIIAVQLYRLCVKRQWIIKMPEAVPEGVSRSFTALIPAFLVAFVILAFTGILVAFDTDIFKIIAVPFGFVVNLTSSWIGILVIYFLIHALWIVGIHGANIISAFITPIVLSNMQLNIEGANIPFAGEFQNSFVVMGGSGATLGLCVFIAFLAKSEQLRVLGKASLAPGLFNINEPLVFGLPIVYNPFLAIPFFLAPMVSASIGYWTIKLELVKPIIAQVPWPSPIGFGAFIGTAGSLMAVLVSLICGFVAFLIWFPFIKIYDKKLVEQEKGNDALI
ncbi:MULTISPECIES: PTS cellobiose transporter subunit IIC [Mammaliicoccus]|jgi:PTS system cellobiose-specific IIC component|uniref:Permease IIC component n=2 Tax=Mammaliicoccus sciuri TaxID=1296 RepID=A0AAW5LKQ5_MAMSC|nr:MULTISPECIES: PTS cellobiose transporter subunit IIC [Mammaliicoccus]ARB41446.1 PTS cellobiose transporter subunit IIC [Mammaliicoccus sciuri]KTT79380.1 PTS system cellobiose-specific transporter subunit IIC [Mammaliicoccus sciuri]KTT83742.1 PTS system cellobiose-specific transporter subunit IIC [Mammaliicoccus sciuri]KTT86700.1 PTS system cellobiose-specific transporter subunit IIC [Mammaliicoccus sciuri]KTT89136.1 PTS system cellobiose-specific transporter subunit IIC [Mammaliicoccus sciu